MIRKGRAWLSTVVCLSLVFFACSVLAAEKKDKNAEKRAEIDATAAKALQEVLTKSPSAKALYDKAYGHAVFSNLKIAIGISGGGGSGVAVPKSGKRVYMKMGTAGVGLGLGGQKYQVVFLFENEKAFRSFVDKGWEADASAQAAAGSKGADAASTFKNGVAYYQLTDKGLMASADISGTKYWKNDDLNK
jgi:lipid-binding SYLF domain-containing protein